MNTTAAALQANVTTATIRAWARRGVIAAVKTAGRWIIDAASLTRRITIGQRKARMTDQPTYRIEQVQIVKYGEDRTAYRIVRTDGTPAGYGRDQDPRIADATFLNRDTAEFYAKFYENTPAGYRIEKELPRANSMDRTVNWLLTGSTSNDPGTLKMRVSSTRSEEHIATIDILILQAVRHAEGAAQRIQDKAERDAVEAAEAAVREARERRLAELRETRGALATPRQVDYILQLLAYRERTGEGGGFFYGPTDRAAIEEMSKADASLYITSLKGDY